MQDAATNSRATSPSGETDQLDSASSTHSDHEDEPRAAVPEAQATTNGGAVAGPGPSSSLKRSLPPASPPASNSAAPSGPFPSFPSSASSLVQPPTKKKRSRASIPLVNSSYRPVPLPHSAMRRVDPATTNSRSNRHVLYINEDVTDARSSLWPAEKEFDDKNREGGKPYWYERTAKTEGKHKAMLEKIGDELAIKLGLVPKGTTEFWILDQLPKNYLYTVHHTVTGSGQARSDPYVFGSPVTVKFRSANEIIPHLYWLIDHGPNDNKRCQCKYCAKKSQSDVNRVEGLSESRTGSVPPASGGGGGGPAAVQAKAKRSSNLSNSTTAAEKDKKSKMKPKPKPTVAPAAVSKPLPSASEEATEEATETVAVEEEKQPVRSRTFNSDSPEPSYSGAFVDKQRDSDLSQGAKYRFGEMVWVRVPQGTLAPASPASAEEEEEESITHWPAIIQHREERTESKIEEPYISGSDAIPKFLNAKRWVYDVIYLGTKNQATGVEEEDVSNWLSSSGIPGRVWARDRLLNRETVEMIWDGARMSKVELGELKTLEQAIAPLAFAMQVAAHVMSSFSLIDRYIVKDGHFVLASDMTDQVQHEIERAKDNWFYQSMYLGSELIWVNDFVRIIHHRDAALPPRHYLSKGSEDRSLFMQIQAIWKDQETKLVKLTGQVYELRDLLDNDVGAGSGTVGSMSMFEKTPTSTASALHEGAGGGLASREPEPIDETSTPPQSSSSAFYSTPLPPAPEGFEFNRVTPGESQVTLELEYLAGRYYPLAKAINSRTKIDEILKGFPWGPSFGSPAQADDGDEATPEKNAEKGTLSESHRAVALAGLTPAIKLYCKVGKWRGDRMNALVEAETIACQEVAAWFEREVRD
ncbi:hypothetical protein JCM11491_001637 [Sporobolomyces phaffii]